MPVRGDGFCFLNAIDMVLYCDHYEVVTFDSMESTILGHLVANVKYYKWFHTGDVSKDTERCFKFRTYCDNILNVITIATTRALNLNLTVYQKGQKGNIQILEQTIHTIGKGVHLKFTRNPCNLAHNYYGAILLFDKPAWRCREEQFTTEGPHSSTLEQPISQDDADEVIDMTDDSEMTAIHQLELVHYTTSNNELQFPTHLFVNIAAEWVEDLPQDIDGLKLYIKCLPREWFHKSWDLRYFKMHSLRRKGLIGTQKVGRCIRNLYCSYDDWPFKLSAEGKGNTSNFQNVDGHKICFSCGNVASRQWCRA